MFGSVAFSVSENQEREKKKEEEEEEGKGEKGKEDLGTRRGGRPQF